MALESSKLSEDIIINLLKEKYNIKILSINKIAIGSANLFKVNSLSNRSYILKEYQSGVSIDKVFKEINITNFLNDCNFKTSKFIENVEGNIVMVNGNNILTLQEFIEGNVVRFFSSTKEQCIEAAVKYSCLIEKLRYYPYDLPAFKKNIFDFNYIWNNIEKCKNLILKNKNRVVNTILYEKKEMLEEALKFDFSGLNYVTVMNSHGDYNSSQFIYDNNYKIRAVIDFLSAKRVPISWELIRSYIYMDSSYDNGSFDVEGLILYLKYFNNKKVLNIFDLENMCLIYYMFLINSFFGVEQVINNKIEYLDIVTKLHEQAKYINRNAVKIKKILIKRKDEIL